MPEAASPTTPETTRLATRTLLAVAAVVAVLLAGTLALWAHYGTAVFFETMRTGFTACFG